MKPLWLGGALVAITLLNFFQFPGHTWLQSDTQIYLPILEHLSDPSVFQKDLIAQNPHVAFTLYDETAIALRRLTGLEFRDVLAGEQFLFRVLGIWGVYLMATALGLSEFPALLVTAIFSLGATIMGPAVLVFEYEPVPRGFAVPLMFLAIGLIAHERYLAAGVAASAAFLMHAPTIAPFWVVYLFLALWPAKPPLMRRRLAVFGVLTVAAVILFAASLHEATPGLTHAFFSRVDLHQAELQRLRASYNWVSMWWSEHLAHYLILYAATVVAWWRLRKDAPPALRFFLIGLPLAGMASLPASYLLLEKLRWAVVPETQPARALLFVTAFAMIFGSIAAAKAIAAKRYVEAVAWLALAYLVPANRVVAWPSWNRAGVVAALALLTSAAMWAIEARRRWAPALVIAAMAAPFLLIPTWGGIENYPPLHNPELAQLSQWARTGTPKDAVFLFPDAGEDLYPGVFRVEALRAVYVDWKAGGQVNFFKDLGEEWWSRWQKTMAVPFQPGSMPRYRSLGIDYVVLLAKDRPPGLAPVFENRSFVVYTP